MAAATMAVGEKAGAGKRFLAFIIDAVILGVLNQLVTSISGQDATTATGLSTVIGIAYVIGFWQAWNGQTPGKRVMGVRIVKADGSAFGLVPSILRYVGYFVSAIALGIGYIWILFDKDKQGWHDKIAGTYVVQA